MAKKKTEVPILAGIPQINRKLAAKGQILKARLGVWLKRKRY